VFLVWVSFGFRVWVSLGFRATRVQPPAS